MAAIHFFENNTLLLSQLLQRVPSIDEKIKIKGRKGKIVSVKQIDHYRFHVNVIFEPVKSKKQMLGTEEKKKKKR